MIRLTLMLIASLFVCRSSSAQSASIEGFWKVEAVATFANMEAAQKDRYSNMPLQKQQHIYKLFESRTFRFYSDSLVQVQFQDGTTKEINGKFRYEATSNRLSINVNGIITLYNIEWLPQNKMRLVFMTPSPQGLLNSLYLVQNH